MPDITDKNELVDVTDALDDPKINATQLITAAKTPIKESETSGFRSDTQLALIDAVATLGAALGGPNSVGQGLGTLATSLTNQERKAKGKIAEKATKESETKAKEDKKRLEDIAGGNRLLSALDALGVEGVSKLTGKDLTASDITSALGASARQTSAKTAAESLASNKVLDNLRATDLEQKIAANQPIAKMRVGEVEVPLKSSDLIRMEQATPNQIKLINAHLKHNPEESWNDAFTAVTTSETEANAANVIQKAQQKDQAFISSSKFIRQVDQDIKSNPSYEMWQLESNSDDPTEAAAGKSKISAAKNDLIVQAIQSAYKNSTIKRAQDKDGIWYYWAIDGDKYTKITRSY